MDDISEEVIPLFNEWVENLVREASPFRFTLDGVEYAMHLDDFTHEVRDLDLFSK